MYIIRRMCCAGTLTDDRHQIDSTWRMGDIERDNDRKPAPIPPVCRGYLNPCVRSTEMHLKLLTNTQQEKYEKKQKQKKNTFELTSWIE